MIDINSIKDGELFDVYEKNQKELINTLSLADRNVTRRLGEEKKKEIEGMVSTGLNAPGYPTEEEEKAISIYSVPFEEISKPLQLEQYIREYCKRYPMHFTVAMKSRNALFFVTPVQWEMMERAASAGMSMTASVKASGISETNWRNLTKEFPAFQQRLDYLRYQGVLKANEVVTKKIDEEDSLEAVKIRLGNISREEGLVEASKPNRFGQSLEIVVNVRDGSVSSDNIRDI